MADWDESSSERDALATLDVKWDVPLHVNGEEFWLHGRGKGDGAEGTLDVAIEFTALPRGFDPWIVTACTSSDSLLFMQERGGAANLLRLTGGNFRILRTISVDDENYLECLFSKQRVDDTIVTTGLVRGKLDLPSIDAVRVMTEQLTQIDHGVIRGHLHTVFGTEEGGELHPRVHGLYAYGTSRTMPFPQMRTAEVRAAKDGLKFDVSYRVDVAPSSKDALVGV